jgi:hypothetical protein
MMFELVYRVRIVYKSGYVQDFECTEFSITDSKITWDAVGVTRPLKLGFDDIAAVWQISVRKRLKFFSK